MALKQKSSGQLAMAMPRRNDENEAELDKAFRDRVMEIFANNRHVSLEQFKKETDSFVKTLNVETIQGVNGTSKFVSIPRIMKILKQSPESIKKLIPFKTLHTLVKITNFKLTVEVALLEELVKSVIHAEQIYIKLLPFAENSCEITAYALQDFVANQYVPMMIDAPERSDYYAAYAVEIIFFLLCARRKEVITLRELLTSTLLMRLEACIESENQSLDTPEVDVFTVASFRSVLQEFRSLDTDRNGVLSKEELSAFRNGYFNEIFLNRIFDISLTYESGCLDFKGFVDLVCAIRFRHTEASAKYHFEALDLKDDGVLDEDEIRTAIKFQAQALPEFADDDDVNSDVITAELKDMLSLRKRLTLSQFVENRMGPTFTGFITNYGDYLKYERREQ